jgi:hypothetical protein
VPLITLGVCAAVLFLYGLFLEGLLGAMVLAGLVVPLSIYYALTGTLAAYTAAAVFGVGFVGAFWTTILKIAAASMSAATVTALIPVGGCFSLIIFIAALVVAAQVLLDLDGEDAKWFTLVFVILQLIAGGLLALAGLNLI